MSLGYQVLQGLVSHTDTWSFQEPVRLLARAVFRNKLVIFAIEYKTLFLVIAEGGLYLFRVR